MTDRTFLRAALPAALTLLCALAGSAEAAVFTVGAGGTHDDVNEALDDAAVSPGDDEVRVQVGTWVGTVLSGTGVDTRTELSGGWDATFTTQTEDPALTVLDANYAGRVLDVSWFTGELVVRNLSFVRGQSTSNGALRLDARNDGRITISDCVVRDSRTNSATPSDGGGVGMAAYVGASIVMERCAVHDNLVETSSQGSGGGLNLFANGSARVELRQSQVYDNRVVGGTHASGGGVSVSAAGDGTVRITDTRIENNALQAGGSTTGAGLVVWQGQGPGASAAQVELRRLDVRGNGATGGFQRVEQVQLEANHDGRIVLGDSVVADGIDSLGLRTLQRNAAALRLVNVTATNNVDADLAVQQGAIEVTNSLFGGVANPGLPMTSSLVSADPGFVDAANGDYRLLLTSPAIGAGTLTPAGGLGDTDLDGNDRVIGPGVDLGAYEADDPTLFVDGFED